jgi:hypothetical protein
MHMNILHTKFSLVIAILLYIIGFVKTLTLGFLADYAETHMTGLD